MGLGQITELAYVVLPGVFLVAAALVAIILMRSRRRERRIRRAEFTELLDVETLKLRTYVASPVAAAPLPEPPQPASRTRKMLDEYRGYGTTRVAAGSTQRT